MSVQSFWNFITAENKVVLNSYLVGIVVCGTESIKVIYTAMWIIDFLKSIIAILHLSTSTDLNTWIAGSHGFAYSSMRATGNPSAALLLQSKHWIDTLTSAHVSAWNATGDRFLASKFMNILKKVEEFPRSSRLLNIYWKLLKKIVDVN